mgnify:CR=1 FL=1
MDQQIDTEKFVNSLPINVQNVIYNSDWEIRVREIGTKYTLRDDQIESLVNVVLLVLAGIDKPDNLLQNITSDVQVSQFISEQIYEDLDKRVFEYVLNLVESEKESGEKVEGVKEKSEMQDTYVKQNYPEIKPVRTPEIRPQNLPSQTLPQSKMPEKVSTPSYTQNKSPLVKEVKRTTEKSFAGRYNRLMKLSMEEYWDLYETLPEILRVIFVSSELSSEIDDIARVNRLNDEQTKGLVLLMGDIILDIHDDGELDALIQKNLGVDSYVSKKITFSIKNRITENIEGLYKKIQSDIEKEEAKASEKKSNQVSNLQNNQQNIRQDNRPSSPPPPVSPPPKIPTYIPPKPSETVPYSSNFKPITEPLPTIKPEPKLDIPESKIQETPKPETKIDLSEEALTRPFGQGSGSRPFGALKNSSTDTGGDGFQKPFGGNTGPRIVFGKSDNDISISKEGPKPRSFEERLENSQDNMGRQRYNFLPKPNETQNSEIYAKPPEQERPAFSNKFGDISFNDPLKETPNVEATKLKEIYDKLNSQQETRDLGSETSAQNKLNNPTSVRIETPPVKTQGALVHEYVVDPYREPIE